MKSEDTKRCSTSIPFENLLKIGLVGHTVGWILFQFVFFFIAIRCNTDICLRDAVRYGARGGGGLSIRDRLARVAVCVLANNGGYEKSTEKIQKKW